MGFEPFLGSFKLYIYILKAQTFMLFFFLGEKMQKILEEEVAKIILKPFILHIYIFK